MTYKRFSAKELAAVRRPPAADVNPPKTEKQVLLAHVVERHRGIGAARGMTHDQLRKAHANAHFRYATDHVHAAAGEVNRGSDERPRGWATGEDVVEKAQGYLR